MGQQGETKAVGSPLDVEGPGGCLGRAHPEPVAELFLLQVSPGPVAQGAMPGCPTIPARGGGNWPLPCSVLGPGCERKSDSHVRHSLMCLPGSCIGCGLPQD